MRRELTQFSAMALECARDPGARVGHYSANARNARAAFKRWLAFLATAAKEHASERLCTRFPNGATVRFLSADAKPVFGQVRATFDECPQDEDQTPPARAGEA